MIMKEVVYAHGRPRSAECYKALTLKGARRLGLGVYLCRLTRIKA